MKKAYPLIKNVLTPAEYAHLENTFNIDFSKLDTWNAFVMVVYHMSDENREAAEGLVDVFLNYGIPVCFTKNELDYINPLNIALKSKNLSVAKKILMHYPQTARQCSTLLEYFCSHNQISDKSREILDLILNSGVKISVKNIISVAAANWDWVDILMQEGVFSPKKVVSNVGMNLLMYFVLSSNFHGHKTTLDQAIERIDFYLSSGIDINAQTEKGYSVLFYAFSKMPELVPHLIKRGANPLLRDAQKNSWLCFCSHHPIKVESDYEAIHLLNDDQQNVLHVLGLELLENYSLYPENEVSEAPFLYNLKWFLQQGLRINDLDRHQYPSWERFFAVYPNSLPILLEYGVDLSLSQYSLFSYVSNRSDALIWMDRLLDLGLCPRSRIEEINPCYPPPESVVAWYDHYYLSQETKRLEQSSLERIMRRV